MRKSVLTGILACTLIFVSQAGNAEASEIAIEKPNEIKASLVNIETMNNTSESPLLKLSEVKEPVDQPEVKKPTVHTVAENETLSTIATQYETTWKRIYSKNVQIADPDLVNSGATLTIPESTEELQDRQAPVEEPVPVEKIKPSKPAAKPRMSTPAAAPRGASSGNGYVAGYCTWYVKNRRPDLPNNLGNASTWVSRAASQGMPTGSVPRAGAVGQRGNHVVYVESVNTDGTVTISEMNHKGRYVYTVRTLPANYFTYIY